MGNEQYSLNDYLNAFHNFKDYINHLYSDPINRDKFIEGYFVNLYNYNELIKKVNECLEQRKNPNQNGNNIDTDEINFDKLKTEALKEVVEKVKSGYGFIIINEELFRLICDREKHPIHKIKYKITVENKLLVQENNLQIQIKNVKNNIISKETILGNIGNNNNINSCQIPLTNYENKLYESIKIYIDNERDIVTKLNTNSDYLYQGFLVDNIWVEKWKTYSNYNNISKLFQTNNLNESQIKNNIRQELLNKKLNIGDLDYIDRFILIDVNQLKYPKNINKTYILLNAKFIGLFINYQENIINPTNFFLSYQKVDIKVNNIPFLSFQTNSNVIINRAINYSSSNSKPIQINPNNVLINNSSQSIKISNSNEINKLKNELSKANKIIEQQKITINELQNKLDSYNTILNNLNNNINNYKNIIVQKDAELNNLRAQFNNNNIKNIQNKVYFNDIMCVNFISSDQNVHYAATCLKTDTFAEIEEKLYKQYPQYRETNNSFLANGTQVLRFKTIAENKIGNGLPVTLIVPS